MENFFKKENYLGVAFGVALLAIGFFLLSRPPVDGVLSLVLSPIILTIAYCAVIPLAIIWRSKAEKKEQ